MAEITRHATEAERRYRDIAEDAKEQSVKAIEDLERAEERLHKQTALLEQREKSNKDLQSEIAQSEKAQQAITQELRKQIEDLQGQVAELGESNERLRTDLAKNELLLDGNKELVETTKLHNKELSEQVKTLNNDVIEQAKTITRLEASQESKQGLMDELKDNKLTLIEQNKVLDTDLRHAQQERHTLQSALGETKASMTHVTERLEQANHQVAELRANSQQQTDTIKRYEENLTERDSKIYTLEALQK